uniref:F-box domain-containing protein n=1 Tax=Populus trichocarpa TaxID=3694 RepID=U5GKG2_POPTR
MSQTSELPDEILFFNILSLLTTKEAARTSVLSSRWRKLQINFAIEKKVKKLEMNLSNCRGISQYNKYFFPHKDFPTCNSLTTLRLKNVNVTGEVIEHFLSNYLALETLYIQSSDSLVNLKVAGPLLRLKYLEIRYCSVKKWRFQP